MWVSWPLGTPSSPSSDSSVTASIKGKISCYQVLGRTPTCFPCTHMHAHTRLLTLMTPMPLGTKVLILCHGQYSCQCQNFWSQILLSFYTESFLLTEQKGVRQRLALRVRSALCSTSTRNSVLYSQRARNRQS